MSADLAALIKAHDFSRMTCYDHDGHCCPEGGCHDVTEHQYDHLARILAAREQALREEIEAELLGELNSEDATAVLYGVTGTHPETYGGVTEDEALECAGELLTRLRALAARIARGETR